MLDADEHKTAFGSRSHLRQRRREDRAMRDIVTKNLQRDRRCASHRQSEARCYSEHSRRAWVQGLRISQLAVMRIVAACG